MADEPHLLRAGAITGRGASLNPFVVVPDASGFIEFVTAVLGGTEVAEARTATPDGLLIHAEVSLGDSLILLSDPQPGWAPRPGLFQIWVSSIDAVIEQATARGSTVVTPPTPFYGSVTLARLEDPWSNLW